jgi:hypothetical protein
MARSKSLQSIVLLIAIAATPAASFADDTIKVLVPQKGTSRLSDRNML